MIENLLSICKEIIQTRFTRDLWVYVKIDNGTRQNKGKIESKINLINRAIREAIADELNDRRKVWNIWRFTVICLERIWERGKVCVWVGWVRRLRGMEREHGTASALDRDLGARERWSRRKGRDIEEDTKWKYKNKQNGAWSHERFITKSGSQVEGGC